MTPDDPELSAAPGDSDPTPDEVATARRALTRDLVLYTAARLSLVLVVVALVLGGGALFEARIPLLVAFVVGVVAALPLSLVLLTGLRTRVADGLTVVGARRRADRAELRARLRGAGPDEPDAPR